MGKYVRVKLPLGSPQGTLSLCQAILEKHSALGAASPLVGFVDMVAFGAKTAAADLLQKTGNEQRAHAKSLYGQAKTHCCIGRGHTMTQPDTVVWFVMQIRDVLLMKYRGVEKDLGLFGFHVVISSTGARKNVRVKIPKNKPADLIELAQKIMEQHTNMGASSPLNGSVDMTRFGALVTAADDLLKNWRKADEEAQSFHEQALVKLGYDKGQTSETEGTIYYDLISIRNRLLQFYDGVEDVMQEFGFHVVVSSKKNGRKRKQVAV